MSSARTSRTHLDGVLRQVWDASRDDVRAQLGVVEQAIIAAQAGALDGGLRERAAREAHKLAGSVGTLGFATASKRARELEVELEAGVPTSDRLPALAEALRDMSRELFGSDHPGDLQPTPDDVPAPAAEPVEPRPEDPLDLLVVDDDAPRARRIVAEAEGRGLAVMVAADVAGARRLLAERSPAIVLLDFSLGIGVDAALGLLTDAARDRPVLVVTDPEQSVDRVAVARHGGRGFLPSTLTAGATVDAVVSLRQRLRPVGTRVLAVDDDPVMLAAIEHAVAGAGLDVRTCGDPRRFWEQLEEHEPDLVMLDFDMPGITGPELCRALRNDQRWQSMPVLFLTSRGSAASIREIFDAGADDYVSKPFVGPELLARILNRLERVQLYRTMADVDALTGTFNRRKSVEDIGRLLRMAERAHQPLTLSILDVDDFKTINDAHGHPVGDAVLRGVGAALHRFLRGDDVIARWGGDEFVIAMYAMSGEDGRQRIGEFLEGIRGARFDEGGAVPVTMSAGLAEYPNDADDLESLYRAADEALYVAKQEGRDRVVHPASRCAAGPDAVLVGHGHVEGRQLEQALQTRGYRTDWIADAAEAREDLAGEASVPVPLLLLDGDLADQGALRLLQLMRQRGKLAHTRTILLSSVVPEANVVAALAQDAVECVVEPVDVPLLMQQIRRPPPPRGHAEHAIEASGGSGSAGEAADHTGAPPSQASTSATLPSGGKTG